MCHINNQSHSGNTVKFTSVHVGQFFQIKDNFEVSIEQVQVERPCEGRSWSAYQARVDVTCSLVWLTVIGQYLYTFQPHS
jgi:hypothetical protein